MTNSSIDYPNYEYVMSVVYTMNKFENITDVNCTLKTLDIKYSEVEEELFLMSCEYRKLDCCKDAYTYYDGNDTIIVLNKDMPEERKHFTTWHEMGHIKLGHFGERAYLSYDSKEKEANCFARNMSIPHLRYSDNIGDFDKDVELKTHISSKVSTTALYVKNRCFSSDDYYCKKIIRNI